MCKPRIVIAPDSFKGSLDARGVAEALAAGLVTGLAAAGAPAPDIEIAPLADGGEGMLEAVAAAGGATWRQVRLTGVHGRPLCAPWLVMGDGTAVIESASVLGLPLIERTPEPPPLAARSSFALGQLIAHALDGGARDLAVGLGGSACNDAGLGLLCALGATARNASGQNIAPSMNGLLALDRIDLSRLDRRLAGCRLRAFCDVDNPLLGPRGASRVYGPQKGLDEREVAAVEAAFARFAERSGARTHAERPGSGAAGGLGFALALLGGRLESGADAILDITGLRSQSGGRLTQADCVITGEGRSDRQTLAGKLPLAVARAAAPTPTVLVCGAIDDDARAELGRHFVRVHTLTERAGSAASAIAEPARWLTEIGAVLAPMIAGMARNRRQGTSD